VQDADVGVCGTIPAGYPQPAILLTLALRGLYE
jgi:hypothetical protein